MSVADRALVLAGAVAGCLGVGLAAAAAHLTGPGSLDVAARFLMMHAPALLAIPALAAAGLGRAGMLRLAGLALALGLLLFSGDLAVRSLTGLALLPLAAPTGGLLLMLGWALVAVGALWRPRA